MWRSGSFACLWLSFRNIIAEGRSNGNMSPNIIAKLCSGWQLIVQCHRSKSDQSVFHKMEQIVHITVISLVSKTSQQNFMISSEKNLGAKMSLKEMYHKLVPWRGIIVLYRETCQRKPMFLGLHMKISSPCRSSVNRYICHQDICFFISSRIYKYLIKYNHWRNVNKWQSTMSGDGFSFSSFGHCVLFWWTFLPALRPHSRDHRLRTKAHSMKGEEKGDCQVG